MTTARQNDDDGDDNDYSDVDDAKAKRCRGADKQRDAVSLRGAARFAREFVAHTRGLLQTCVGNYKLIFMLVRHVSMMIVM